MKNITDYKNEEALDLLVAIMDPVIEIMSDKEAVQKLYSDSERMSGVKELIARHKRSVTEIFAAIDGVPVEEYEYSILMLPIRILEILNNKEMVAFFTAQQSLSSNGHSGDATENTEESGS